MKSSVCNSIFRVLLEAKIQVANFLVLLLTSVLGTSLHFIESILYLFHFEDLKNSMNAILRILMSLVVTHAKDVNFLVDSNFTYVQGKMANGITL